MSVTTDRPVGSASRGHWLERRRWVPVVVGIGFTVSWVCGLALPVPNLAVTASAAEVLAKYGPHLGMVQAQFALTEGLPAIGLAVISLALALLARRSGPGAEAGAAAGAGRAEVRRAGARRAGARRAGARRAGARRARVIAVAGTVAAVISVTQYALGVMLAGWALPDHAAGPSGGLWEAINRLDGVKMFALAVLASAAVALTAPTGPLPRWLRYASLTLAASITVSGVAYLFLIQDLSWAAYVAGAALLVWVTGMGVALGRIPGRDGQSPRAGGSPRATGSLGATGSLRAGR
jgi:hypothetical protein